MVDGENVKQVIGFWNDCIEDGSFDWICSKAGQLGALGIFKHSDKYKDEFIYMIGAEKNEDALPSGYVSTNIPAATWAVFESVGALPEALYYLIQRIFAEWMPATGYQHDWAPEIEVYPKGDIHSPDYRCEFWIPVRK